MIAKIPVFFHVPKCAGTFVYTSLLSGARWVRIKNGLKGERAGVETIRSLWLMAGREIQARIVVFDRWHALDALGEECKLDACSWGVEIEELSSSVWDGLVVLGVVIAPEGIRCAEAILRLIPCNFVGGFYKFIILRETFDRERSFYHYMVSEGSRHEPTHGRVPNESFAAYLSSSLVSDSWLIRNLLGLEDSTILTEEHFFLAREKLNGVRAYDIAGADPAVGEMLRECYGVERAEIKFWATPRRNNTAHPSTKIEELPSEVQRAFEERTYWDRRFYREMVA